MTKASSFILRLYFALVSAVTLFTLMFGAIDFLTLGLKSYIFTSADVPSYGLTNCDDPTALDGYYGRPVAVKAPTDTTDTMTAEEQKARCVASNATTMENYSREKATQAVRNLALILVSLPLFVIHFRIVYRDWKEERNSKES